MLPVLSPFLHVIMINCHRFFPPRLNRMLSQSLIVGAFATVGVISGVAPDISARSGVVFSSAAYAQAISNTEVTNYARSVLVMEPVRQTAFTEIKKMISGDIPPIVCHKPGSLNALPGNARKIAVNYCRRSQEIVESNGLTINRFNAITVNLQNNPDLKRRIHNELIRIQNPAYN